MKLPPQRVAAFLRDPGAVPRCAAVWRRPWDDPRPGRGIGAGGGRIAGRPVPGRRTRAGDVGLLAAEAASLALTGGRRVVRLREATDAATDQVAAILKGAAPALVVLEAPGLATRSRLRTLLEAAPDGAAIACYPEEGRALTETIRAALGETGVGIDADALSWVSDQLGADRVSTRQEVEKLALYVGPGGRVDLDAAMACVGDLAGLSLDDALFAATEGDVAALTVRWSWLSPRAPHRSAVLRAATDASAAAASGAAGGGRRAKRGRCGEERAPAGVLPTVERVQPRARIVVIRRIDGGDRRAGGGGARLQAHRGAGCRVVAQCRADPGASCGSNGRDAAANAHDHGYFRFIWPLLS